MTDFFHWPTEREKAIRLFRGEIPKQQTEADIVEVFEQRPQLVITQIARVAADLDRGAAIRSAWAILRKRVTEGSHEIPDVTAVGTLDRAVNVKMAELWLRNAGLHVDRLEELEDELFGDRGLLRAYEDDQELREHMVSLWCELRPLGEQVDVDAERRAQEWKEHQDELKQLPKLTWEETQARLEQLVLGENDHTEETAYDPSTAEIPY